MKYGSSDEELSDLPTVYRDDLLEGQVFLVSGGGSGLGKASAALLARLGAKLVICGRDGEKLDAAARYLSQFGGEVLPIAMSIRDPDAVEALMDKVWKQFGGLDVLVNNAGGQFPANALDITPKGWRAVVDTNLNGTWYMMQEAARRWRATDKAGSIVNIVTVIWRGQPQIAHSCAARAGVVYLSKSVAVEWAPYNIRVNCVAPGCVETTAFALYPEEGTESFYRANPMMRAGDEFDIAQAIIYLSAASGKFITGETVTVDGGQQNWGVPWFAGRPDYFDSE